MVLAYQNKQIKEHGPFTYSKDLQKTPSQIHLFSISMEALQDICTTVTLELHHICVNYRTSVRGLHHICVRATCDLCESYTRPVW